MDYSYTFDMSKNRTEVLTKLFNLGFKFNSWDNDNSLDKLLNEFRIFNWLVVFPLKKDLGANFQYSDGQNHTKLNSLEEFLEIYNNYRAEKRKYVPGM